MTYINEEQNMFNFPAMVEKLEYLHRQKKIEILHANFETGDIKIDFTEECKGDFKSVLDRIKFVEMSPRLKVKSADFKTGNLVIHVLDHDKDTGLNDKELDLLRRNKTIEAIKSVRARKRVGLADAKRYIEDCKEKLIKKGIL